VSVGQADIGAAFLEQRVDPRRPGTLLGAELSDPTGTLQNGEWVLYGK